MLQSLRVRHFAIIDDLELTFQPGFTVISGETGAGKSILVDALGIVFGQRADSNLVRTDAERAELSASFDLQQAPAAHHWLRAQQLDAEDECLLRRTLSASGGSRAWINGTPVTVQQLQAFAEHMIDIHGQHEQQRLLQPAACLALVDSAGVASDLRERVSQLAASHHELQQQLQSLTAASGTVSNEARQLLRYQLDELDAAADSIARLDELYQRQQQLAHADQLQQALAATRERLDEDDSGALDLLRQCISELDEVSEFNQACGDIRDMLDEAAINVRESISSLQQQLDQIELDPHSLQQVEAELTRLHDLARKHRVDPIRLAEHHRQLQQQWQSGADAEHTRQQLEQDLQRTQQQYDEAAKALHAARAAVAATLSSKVEALLHSLSLDAARLQIEVSHHAERSPNASGRDRVDILFSANPGQNLRPLAKVASGGELSRIGLALMVATQQHDGLPAMIFDEVDAGIGGATAATVGAMLAKLAQGRQAFCVTHMAQVAAFADHHILVSKSATGEVTRTSHTYLDADQRIEELARMLSGKITASSLQHAREMRSESRPEQKTD